ncbi:glycosyltransferase family 4 protein [Cytobacillus sp. OWB-43]|uniref:glycosyltransferase family 4 protein n=1 Tax=Cytobacillus sp. OWB-43 TaxID=3108468 RepID=UPI002AFDFA02|nr:glycosyltransferase family 4 protein [Cytobacillus sp. OWB-43]MEA1854383.1 glycosyltransferase family 4 protein [Cytobacillus sp. OWB-43]
MRLALICTEKLPSPAIKGGAIQMMIDGVVPFLSKENNLTIFSVTDPSLPDYEVRNEVQYIRLPSESYEIDIAKILTEKRFDIIHVFNRPLNIPLYKKASPSSQFVLGLHNDMLSEKKVSLENGKEIVNSVERIVTVSEYIKQTVVERFPEAESKTKVVYSGVDLVEYPPVWSEKGKQIREEYRQKYNIGDKKVILFVGRLTKNKGPHLLISAFKAIAKRYPHTLLVIAGGKWFSDDGINNYIRYLKKLAEPLGDKVIFTNFIPASEISNIFLMSDIFCCSSQWQEPLARVHYEAFAAGIPIISTNRGGNAEIVSHKETGYLIEKYDQASEFAKGINFYLKNPDTINSITRNARELVESNFQFHHVASRLTNVYSELIPKQNNDHYRKMFRSPLFRF